MTSLVSTKEVEIELDAGAHMPAHAFLHVGAQRGIVVLHEVFGMQPEILRAGERIAEQGYAVVVPDLFAGGARIACLARVLRATASGTGKPIAQIHAARAWLVANVHIEEARVGLVGFCMGGGLALAAGRGWGAVSTNYGPVPKPDVLRGIGPVIGCYGRKDLHFRGKAKTLQKRLSALNVPHEAHVFEGVGHSFLTDGHHPVAQFLNIGMGLGEQDPVTREEGWRRIFAFLGRHL